MLDQLDAMLAGDTSPGKPTLLAQGSKALAAQN